MRLFFFFLLASSNLMAQQQVVPEEFNKEQRQLFKRVTESVSAPCCKNGIPVAYHESGMSIYLRNLIKDAIKAGDSEEKIFAMLHELRLGEEKMEVIFTVPEDNAVGWLAWTSPLFVIALGLAIIFAIKSRGITRRDLSDDQLIDRYRDHIRGQIEDPAKTS